MAREPSTEIDDFRIGFHPLRHGWSRLSFKAAGFEEDAWVTEIFDTATITLIDFCRAVVENEATTKPFYDEPGGVILRITPLPKRQHTIIFEIFLIPSGALGKVLPQDCETPAFQMVAKRRVLATSIVMELMRAAILYQEPSFQKGRPDFPFEEFRALVKAWKGQGWADGLDQLIAD
ncbi:hypothetical protein [Endobacterium cereale]|uniref:hypothetical protein n=1 Tax=Endobacterium cereale TaxID=2663029 RepID=UPI002B49A428|nr:hypothetical protein [Endobacterium cereale]MEB2845724.1 hypothetical protein [Endobacterium cereale]